MQQLLRQVLAEEPIRVVVEYDAAEARTTVTVRYGGRRFDPAEGENELAYRVLKASVEELTYEYVPDEEESNIIRVDIKE